LAPVAKSLLTARRLRIIPTPFFFYIDCGGIGDAIRGDSQIPGGHRGDAFYPFNGTPAGVEGNAGSNDLNDAEDIHPEDKVVLVWGTWSYLDRERQKKISV